MGQELLSTDPKAGFAAAPAVVASAQPGERTRQDTNILGIDHEKLKAMVGKWVSGLDPTFQQPAAVKAADFLASLAEMFSSPETVATMGAGGVPKPAAAVERPSVPLGARVGAAARPVMRATSAALDNDIAGAISPRAAHLGKIATRVSDVLEKRAATAAESASPAASRPAAPTAPSAPTPAVAAPKSPAAPSLSLSPEETQAVQELVKQGYPEADVLRELQAQRATAPAAPTASKPKLVGAELKEYVRLINTGKSPAQAIDLIVQQRALTEKLGLPSSETVRRSVADRNVSGRWKEDQ